MLLGIQAAAEGIQHGHPGRVLGVPHVLGEVYDLCAQPMLITTASRGGSEEAGVAV
jgi:hypothetical protein